MKIRITLTVTILSLAILVALLPGCYFDRWVEVRDGYYVPIDTESSHPSPAVYLIRNMHVDRENNNLELTLEDGSSVKQSFAARQKQSWPSACPASLGSTRMEVLDLEENKLVIGDITINNPILVRNCPDDPERVILREDGQIGGAGTACAHDEKCIHFKTMTK